MGERHRAKQGALRVLGISLKILLALGAVTCLLAVITSLFHSELPKSQ
jgi:hypothetical protein